MSTTFLVTGDCQSVPTEGESVPSSIERTEQFRIDEKQTRKMDGGKISSGVDWMDGSGTETIISSTLFSHAG